jgi:hypothetical protein
MITGIIMNFDHHEMQSRDSEPDALAVAEFVQEEKKLLAAAVRNAGARLLNGPCN